MNAKTITNRAANAAAEHGSDTIGRLSFHVGALEAEVQSLCKELAQFKPVEKGTETTFSHAGCDMVVFYESDEEGDFDINGVYANGMNVHGVVSEEVMDLICEHVTNHTYVLRKQAEINELQSALRYCKKHSQLKPVVKEPTAVPSGVGGRYRGLSMPGDD